MAVINPIIVQAGGIDPSDANAVVGDVLASKTFYAGNETKKTGTMVDRGTVNTDITTKAQEVTIEAGKHSGSGKVKISATEQAKIIAENIKKDVTVLGTTGTYAGEGGDTLRGEGFVVALAWEIKSEINKVDVYYDNVLLHTSNTFSTRFGVFSSNFASVDLNKTLKIVLHGFSPGDDGTHAYLTVFNSGVTVVSDDSMDYSVVGATGEFTYTFTGLGSMQATNHIIAIRIRSID